MKLPKLLPLTAAALMLVACEARFGNDARDAGGGSAEGKAENGQVSISAPGFEMELDIPEGVQREAGIDDDSGLIYPNAQFSGIHVEGGREGGSGRSDGEVELRFTSSDAPDVIARWYRDPARASDFSVGGAGREGNDLVISGSSKDDNGQFRVRLSPRSGGGTDGRVVLSDRG
jgi:hypothetical protein